MRFCYVDETGTDGQSAVSVMVGVICDAQRLARARSELGEMFSQGEFDLLKEVKGHQLYRGKGRWSQVEGAVRHRLLGKLVDWVVSKKHRIALAALPSSAVGPVERIDTWRTLALHIALQLQRNGQQAFTGGKGRTVLIFDENKQQVDHIAELLAQPPSWSLDYYGGHTGAEPLDQIIDTAFAAKSHHVGMIQLADVFAYLFLRYEQLSRTREAWDGETEQLSQWIEKLSSRLLPPAHRWPRRSTSECAAWYAEQAPAALVDLGRKVPATAGHSPR